MASEVSHVLKEADTPQDTQFTINLYNCFGMITKTYHPKTVSEPVHIGSDESSDLIGFPTGSLTLRIGTENVIAEDGSTITYNIQPYCLKDVKYWNQVLIRYRHRVIRHKTVVSNTDLIVLMIKV